MIATNSGSKTDKRNAVLTGGFFIAATVAAITGLKLYDPLLAHPDYLVQGAMHSTQVILGACFELILVCSAAGTAIMLFPYLKNFNTSLGLGYVCFRMLEAVFILVGIVSVLALLSLSQSFTNTSRPDIAVFQTSGAMLKSIHDWTFMLGPLFMLGINTFIYNYVFYRSGLVPRKLALMGLAGAVLVFASAILIMFGIISQLSVWGVLMAMPVAVYEMILAVWLIAKGFNLGRAGE